MKLIYCPALLITVEQILFRLPNDVGNSNVMAQKVLYGYVQIFQTLPHLVSVELVEDKLVLTW